MGIQDGRVVGLPLVDFKAPKAVISGLTSVEAGMTAYATDTSEWGFYAVGGVWFWLPCTHTQLSDMPDTSGVNTDHDVRLVPKVSLVAPTIPPPFEGMLWVDQSGTLLPSTSLVTVTSAHTVGVGEVMILANGTFNVTLPTVVGNYARVIHVKNIGGVSDVITVVCNGVETIDGQTSFALSQYDPLSVVSDEIEWRVR